MSNNRRKFSNYLVNPAYQLRFVLGLIVPGVAVIAAYSTLMYSHVRENYEILVELSPMTAEAKAQLYSELWQMTLQLGISSGVFLLAMAALAIILSHRTAGPLYHFKRVFQEIRSGHTSMRIRLRPKDDFQDVAKAFNQMMDERFQSDERFGKTGS